MHRRRPLPDSLRLVGSVLRVPDLRRVELAYVIFGMTEYAVWVAILVYAYGIAGATGAGLAALVQLLPSAAVAPIASSFGDLFGLRRSLLGGYAAQAVTNGGVAAALWMHAPISVVIGVAVL